MKTIGMVGGTTWLSTVDYYRLLNEMVNERLGGTHNARCILYSFNFGEIQVLTERRDWPAILELVTRVCRDLTAAGAEGIMLCANTMHLIADDLAKRIEIPIIHIVDATGEAIERQGMKRVGLLGTRYTMEMDFYPSRLATRGIETITPEEADREFIHATIFGELARGELRDDSRRRFIAVIDALAARGAQGVVLGCTEIPLLVKQTDCALPLFDTTRIHAEAVVRFALADEPTPATRA